jgi:hypothetical protein
VVWELLCENCERGLVSKREISSVLVTLLSVLLPNEYLEWLRSKVTMTEEMNRKVSDEIDVLAETTGKGCFC